MRMPAFVVTWKRVQPSQRGIRCGTSHSCGLIQKASNSITNTVGTSARRTANARDGTTEALVSVQAAASTQRWE